MKKQNNLFMLLYFGFLFVIVFFYLFNKNSFLDVIYFVVLVGCFFKYFTIVKSL